MHRDEARRKAQLWWGPNAYIAWSEPDSLYYVADQELNLYTSRYGRGNTWEEAFQDAVRRNIENSLMSMF